MRGGRETILPILQKTKVRHKDFLKVPKLVSGHQNSMAVQSLPVTFLPSLPPSIRLPLREFPGPLSSPGPRITFLPLELHLGFLHSDSRS